MKDNQLSIGNSSIRCISKKLCVYHCGMIDYDAEELELDESGFDSDGCDGVSGGGEDKCEVGGCGVS